MVGWLALAGCQVLGWKPETPSFTTMCDGCLSTTVSPSPEPAGSVSLLELEALDPEPLSVRTWPGRSEEVLGYRLVRVGDLDEDGLDDVWCSGSDGAVLRSSDPDGTRFAELHADPVPVGDLDADGLGELVLGGYQATVASVLPGAELRAGGEFQLGDGWVLAGGFAFGGPAPDLDLDGVPETSWIDQDWPDSTGTRVRVLPGASSIGGLWREDALATVVVPEDAINAGGAFDVGDVDGDGVGDLAVGVVSGYVYAADAQLLVWSGADLAQGVRRDLAVIVADGGLDLPRFDVERLGDLDGDGREDLAIAVLARDASTGVIASGAELRGRGSLTRFGRPLELPRDGRLDARDLDGDGWSELLVVDPTGGGEVHEGSELAHGVDEPTWSWHLGTSGALAGLDPVSGHLLVWVGDDRA